MQRRSGIVAAIACVLASTAGACLSFGDLSGGDGSGAGNDGSVSDSSSGDASNGDASVSDAGGDSSIISAPDGSCNFDDPFSTPIALTNVNSTYDDWSARLSVDQLTLYFGSERPPRLDGGQAGIFVSTRASATDSFGAAALVPGGLNFAFYANHPSVTSDGLSIFIETNATGHTDIYSSIRPSTAVDFGAPMSVANINVAGMDQNAPFIMPGGSTIYFSRSAPGGGIRAIMRATISGGSFATAVAVNELNNAAYDSTYPAVSADNTTIFFASTRTGGKGASDIWKAERASPADAFSNITAVAELNTAYGDYPSWISPDECTLYFFSNRATSGAAGGLDLYVAERGK